MAVAIDATVGGASANSYVLLAEADAYAESRLNASSWEDDASDDEKNRALVEATRDITTCAFDGERVTSGQALAWPRNWACDPDSPLGAYFDAGVIPQRVKDAVCELALQYIKAGTTDVAALDPSANIKREKIDVLETEYFDSYQRASGLARYPRVMALLAPLLVNVSGLNARTVRG